MYHMTTDYNPTSPPDDVMRDILQRSKVIAVVGLTGDTSRPSYGVAEYLQRQGYRIVPVSPKAGEVLGEQAYPDLPSIPFDVDIVDIFRRSEAVGPHVDEAIQKGVGTVWIQLGIRNDEAAQQARDAGFDVVMDHCIKIEHSRLMR
jgi:predicted CoA-binding protein